MLLSLITTTQYSAFCQKTRKGFLCSLFYKNVHHYECFHVSLLLQHWHYSYPNINSTYSRQIFSQTTAIFLGFSPLQLSQVFKIIFCIDFWAFHHNSSAILSCTNGCSTSISPGLPVIWLGILLFSITSSPCHYFQHDSLSKPPLTWGSWTKCLVNLRSALKGLPSMCVPRRKPCFASLGFPWTYWKGKLC